MEYVVYLIDMVALVVANTTGVKSIVLIAHYFAQFGVNYNFYLLCSYLCSSKTLASILLKCYYLQ